MTRTLAEKRADVWRVVEGARAVARDRAVLVGELVRSTGLSREGVDIAFERHLELDPTEAEIDALVAFAASAGVAKHVVVILSANVFVGALRAVAIARAASPSVVVRPSRREPHFARALVAKIADAALTLVDDVDLARLFGGEVHVYGRDATIAAVRAGVAKQVRVRGHGAGMGIAMVGPGAVIEDAARALASDVIAFDQRGCLSPRVALVEGEGRAGLFAEALDAALTEAAKRVPRGVLHEDERAEAARYAATMEFAGRAWVRATHVIGLAPRSAPVVIPPTGRHVHLATIGGDADARAVMESLAAVIVCVGADESARATEVAPAHARVSALGEMQRPRLDGPVDRR
jgi:hypothetical protein